MGNGASGGKCSDSGRSRKFKLSELVDLDIGQSKEMPDGCGPNVSGTQWGSNLERLKDKGFGWPGNNEFDYAGRGSSCQMCSLDYGCDNCGGGWAVSGSRGKVKRTAYKGDPLSCCRIQPASKIHNGKTCNPKYINNYRTDDCDTHMGNYCKKGDNFESKGECTRWYKEALEEGRTNPNTYIKEFCMKNNGEKFPGSFCQGWVDTLKNTDRMEGEYDEVVRSYCNNHPDNPRCACMVTPDKISKLQEMATTSKVCWYKPCQDNKVDNYITNSMLKQKRNCVSTACLIDAGDVDLEGEGNRVSFKNECGAGATGVPTEPEPQPQPSLGPGGGPSPQPSPGNGDGDSADVDGNGEVEDEEGGLSSNRRNILLAGGSGMISLVMCLCCLILLVVIYFFIL